MDVVNDDDAFVFVVTEGGWAKRTALGEYRVQGRGGLGIKVAKLNDDRGDLVAGMVVGEDDEVLVVMEHGKVVRSPVTGVPAKGRDTMGVVFAKPDNGDRIIAVARNSERALGGDEDLDDLEGDPEAGGDEAATDGVVTDGVTLAVEAALDPTAAPVEDGRAVAEADAATPDATVGDDQADGDDA
jgi:DNA gyrase subunit A